MAGEITINNMLQAPTIRRVISTIRRPLSAFQQHFKMTPGSGATERTPTGNITWDIANRTRTLAKIRPRGSGPGKSSEKPIGSNSATLVRMHDSIHIEQDKVYGTRELGKGFDTPMDLFGQKYIERQLQYLSDKFANSREFMLSRLFRNGFGVSVDGDDYNFVEATSADAFFTVDYKIPAANRSKGEMGTGANIFQDPWDNPATDIPGQLYAARKAMIRLTGLELTEFWINSSTFAVMQNNNFLASVAGSANTVFTSINGMTIKKEETDAASGFMVEFRALPLFKFYVYDGVLNIAGLDDSTTAANSSLFIPDGHMIGTPTPNNEWIGCVEGSEIVAESYVDTGKNVNGFHSWKNRTILPPGWDLVAVDNWLPILYVPSAVIYIQVY